MKIGFIGLGNMGGSIAKDLANGENAVMVSDVSKEILEQFRGLGAKVAASPAEVASECEIVGICVRTDEQVLEVMNGPNGILSAARPGLLVAIHSTIHLETFHDLCKAADSKGIRLIDAPVSRGTDAPKTKAIVFMVGGAPEDVERALPYVQLAALKVVQTGKRGSAMALKICNNVITYLMLLTLRDAFRLAEGAGVDLGALAEVTSANGVAGPNMLFSIRKRSGADTRVHHVVDTAETNAQLGEKDLSCALDAAAFLGVKLPVVEIARNEIRAAMFEMLR